VLGRLLGLRPGTVHPAQRQRWPTVPSPRHGGMLTDGATASHQSSSLRRKHGCEVGVMLCNRRGSRLTRTAWHRRGRKMGPMATASTLVAISGERRQRLKAPAAPGSPARGEGQDQSIRRGSEAALTEEGCRWRRWLQIHRGRQLSGSWQRTGGRGAKGEVFRWGGGFT
jgi:hypothetical protein